MERGVPTIIEWDPERPIFADTHPKYHPITNAAEYARANRIGLVAIKVAEGAGWRHREQAKRMVMEAEAQGLIVLGYAYGSSRPDVFLRDFLPAPGRIPCLDFEGRTAGAGPEGVSRETAIRMADRWIRIIRRAWERAPWFYGRHQWMEMGEREDTEVADCPFWGAQYGSHLSIPRGVGRPVAWQYTDGSHLGPAGAPRIHAGIGGPGCDMSALLVPIGDLRQMAGLSSTMSCEP